MDKILRYEPTTGIYLVTPDIKSGGFFFCHDYPSEMITRLERDLTDEKEKGFRGKFIFIRTFDYFNTGYEWLPFTLALHILILAPDDIKVVITDETAVCLKDISDRIDAERGKQMMCFRNFSIYTNVTKDNRAPRVFLQNKYTGNNFIPCYNEIHNESLNHFSPYYERWLRSPWYTGSFYTHPFDHLPVMNLGFNGSLYGTRKQWEKEGRRVVNENIYILAHPQMGNVCVKRYYSIFDTQI